MKKLNSLLFALLVSASAPAFSQTIDTPQVPVANFAQPDVATVRMLLSGYHDLAPKDAFEAVPNGPQIVLALAHGKHSVIRDRALAALGRYWPSADVYLLYANVIGSPETADGTLHRVVLMYAAAFGERALPVLRPLLDTTDLQLQITVVQAMGEIATDQSRAVVNEFAKNVSNPTLLAAIDKATTYAR